MEAKLIGLEVLLQWLWELNPKLHQDVLIQFSILEYGFNDRVGVCSKFKLVMEGHGRLGNLKQLKDAYYENLLKPEAERQPLRIPENVVEEAGEWLIPCDDHEHFKTREDALQYALMHNRSGTTVLDLRDYDPKKLQGAITAAAAGKQMGFELPGFRTGDFADATTSIGVQAGQPVTGNAAGVASDLGSVSKAAVFDPSALADAPGYQIDQTPQTYVVMVTAPSPEAFARVVHALTLGTRKSLPDGARFASVESNKYVEVWERLLVPPEGNGSAVTAVEPAAATTPVTAEPAAVAAPEYKPTPEPEWDELGYCTRCNGKGYTSRRLVGTEVFQVYCSICEGHANRTTWEAAHTTAQATTA